VLFSGMNIVIHRLYSTSQKVWSIS